VASLACVGGALAAVVTLGGGFWLRSVAQWSADVLDVTGLARLPLMAAIASGILTGGLEMAALPAAAYLGLSLERRYDLSHQSTADWWRDHIKAAGIGLAMTMTAAAVIYAALRWLGPLAWLAAGLALALLGALVAIVAPVVLLPLFYRFQALPPG